MRLHSVSSRWCLTFWTDLFLSFPSFKHETEGAGGDTKLHRAEYKTRSPIWLSGSKAHSVPRDPDLRSKSGEQNGRNLIRNWIEIWERTLRIPSSLCWARAASAAIDRAGNPEPRFPVRRRPDLRKQDDPDQAVRGPPSISESNTDPPADEPMATKNCTSVTEDAKLSGETR